MQALISQHEPRETGWRVAQVEPDDKVFPVSAGMFWFACADNVVADKFFYDVQTNAIKPIPEPVPVAPVNQPKSTGAQTL